MKRGNKETNENPVLMHTDGLAKPPCPDYLVGALMSNKKYLNGKEAHLVLVAYLFSMLSKW